MQDMKIDTYRDGRRIAGCNFHCAMHGRSRLAAIANDYEAAPFPFFHVNIEKPSRHVVASRSRHM